MEALIAFVVAVYVTRYAAVDVANAVLGRPSAHNQLRMVKYQAPASRHVKPRATISDCCGPRPGTPPPPDRRNAASGGRRVAWRRLLPDPPMPPPEPDGMPGGAVRTSTPLTAPSPAAAGRRRPLATGMATGVAHIPEIGRGRPGRVLNPPVRPQLRREGLGQVRPGLGGSRPEPAAPAADTVSAPPTRQKLRDPPLGLPPRHRRQATTKPSHRPPIHRRRIRGCAWWCRPPGPQPQTPKAPTSSAPPSTERNHLMTVTGEATGPRSAHRIAADLWTNS